MPRIARFIRDNQPSVYHIVSRTALQGLPIKDKDNDFLLGLIKKLSQLYFVDVLGFALLGNHFHLVIRMYPESEPTDEEIKERLQKYYGDELKVTGVLVSDYRKRLTNLGAYVKDIKQGFTRYFNKKYGRRGFFWGDRFKSMIVQDGLSLVNLLAYVDLNPIRAGIVKKPEDYRWCSLGYHTQTGNKDGLLLDFGMKEWNEFDPKEIVRKYRQFVYETGAVDAGKGKTMDKKIVEKARKKGYKISRTDRFRYRCRYFTDSGVIGGKDFVQEVFDQVKHLLGSKDTRKFTPVGGVDGVYSMKRLASSINYSK
ncbi:transposase [Desulfonatronovibrio magnus]|uniref:transposase n=1 Tax=Desulfonatronovibrio magnus TaxID=698827 RepID=UPI0005EAD157|nr:transposase [Desulfonatronovibrio magnus]